jgi:hypothetical protein
VSDVRELGGKVRFGYISLREGKSGQVVTGYAGLSQVMPSYARLCQVMSGYAKVMPGYLT